MRHAGTALGELHIKVQGSRTCIEIVCVCVWTLTRAKYAEGAAETSLHTPTIDTAHSLQHTTACSLRPPGPAASNRAPQQRHHLSDRRQRPARAMGFLDLIRKVTTELA